MLNSAYGLQIGMSGLRRIRVGEYRLIYEVDGGKLTVLVVRVRHRRDAYRRSR
ncbi:hypothetical protein Nhal_0600 [Nitrosococcus halophilus Nc 4]|uniref:Plasmid stabilization system n=1 Tax=Nitrosococcus halophilus (strain Nc4) TaxID=472759 RepID=D5BWQ3_NITHN|nr:type II toxin-antitoxin system RelE/ParE family toxin [Nitrosococcus halophilus]ADE13784.1 hypothetical protein Nhal_0600 [Nitrosococcus halophilus Nc 4]